MIGFLRFVGILNAAVWFGAAVFFTFWSGRAPFSPEMKALLGPHNYPYFSGAIAKILIARYFSLQFICSIIAIVHLLAEWLYLGRFPQNSRLGLLLGLCLAVMVGGYWLQPRMKALHATKYAHNQPRPGPRIRRPLISGLARCLHGRKSAGGGRARSLLVARRESF